MTQTKDGVEGKPSIRNQTDTANSNIEPSISYDEEQIDSDSEVTRYIKDSITRANRNTADKFLESTVRQITEATSNFANEMPKVAARTIQAANKIVSVGREGVNSINHRRNTVSLNRKE
jgi:hypothetical protein